MSTTSPTVAVIRTEARLFSREVASAGWIVAFPTVLLGILWAVPDFRTADPDLDGRRVVDLYVPVSVLLSMIMAAILTMPPVLLGYRDRGILRRMRTTPIAPGSLLLAQAVLHAGAVLVSAVLVLGVGTLALGTPAPGAPVGYAVALVFALAAAFSIGALITAVSPNSRIGATIATIALFPAMFSAGVWAPVQVMDGLLRVIVGSTPLGAASEALDTAMRGGFPELGHLGIMSGWSCLFAVVAARLFRWE